MIVGFVVGVAATVWASVEALYRVGRMKKCAAPTPNTEDRSNE